MPAIQPALLRQQSALLAEHFFEPSAFVRSLHHLLDYYADRSRRPGQVGVPESLLKAYQVRPPVLRQIKSELIPFVEGYPVEATILCDVLWVEPVYELRILAIAILGKIVPWPTEPIIQRIEAWMRPVPEKHLVDVILQDGCSRLRMEQPEAYFYLVGIWMNSADEYLRRVGLQALLPLITDPVFQNIPVIFRLIQTVTRSVPAVLRQDLLDVIEALARRTPQETAFFLRQILTLEEAVGAPFLIRQSLHAFPPEIEESLRTEVRKYNKGM